MHETSTNTGNLDVFFITVYVMKFCLIFNEREVNK